MENYSPNSHKIIRTEELIKRKSDGNLAPQLEDLLNRRLDLEVELERKSKYEKNFKKFCVVYDCKNSLPGTWEHYKENGNFCKDCRTRINKAGAREMSPEARGKFIKLFGALAN